MSLQEGFLHPKRFRLSPKPNRHIQRLNLRHLEIKFDEFLDHFIVKSLEYSVWIDRSGRIQWIWMIMLIIQTSLSWSTNGPVNRWPRCETEKKELILWLMQRLMQMNHAKCLRFEHSYDWRTAQHCTRPFREKSKKPKFFGRLILEHFVCRGCVHLVCIGRLISQQHWNFESSTRRTFLNFPNLSDSQHLRRISVKNIFTEVRCPSSVC